MNNIILSNLKCLLVILNIDAIQFGKNKKKGEREKKKNLFGSHDRSN